MTNQKLVLKKSDRMTRADLIKEIEKAQRWINSAERNAAKADLKYRKEMALVGNTDLAVKRDETVRHLSELVETYEMASAIAERSNEAPYKLVRAVLIPGPNNHWPDLRLTIDLIVNSTTNEWDGKYPAFGFSASASDSSGSQPIVLRGEELEFSDGDHSILRIRGRAIQEQAIVPFFFDGQFDQSGMELYRVAKSVSLLTGEKNISI